MCNLSYAYTVHMYQVYMFVERPNRKSKRGIRFPAVHELKRNALAKINFMLPDVGHSAKFLAEI